MNNYPTANGAPPAAADIKELVALGRSLGDAKANPTPDGAPFAVVPPGYTVAALPTIALPARAKGNIKLRDAPSFVRYFNDHKSDAARIYAQVDPAKFLAVAGRLPASRANGQVWQPTIH